MRFSTLTFGLVATLVGSALALPAAPDSLANVPAEVARVFDDEGSFTVSEASTGDDNIDAVGCGTFKFGDGNGLGIQGDWKCRNMGQPISTYIIRNNCSCFFFDQGGCNFKNLAAAHKGPKNGSLSGANARAYICTGR